MDPMPLTFASVARKFPGAPPYLLSSSSLARRLGVRVEFVVRSENARVVS